MARRRVTRTRTTRARRDEAYAGIAAAGYTTRRALVGRGLDGARRPRRRAGRRSTPAASTTGSRRPVLSAHSDLTTADGVDYGIKAVRWCAEQRPADHEHGHRRPLRPGGERGRVPLQHRGGSRTRRTPPASTSPSRSTATSWPRGALTVPLLERIGHPRIKVDYDTANCEFYGDVAAVDDLAVVGALPGEHAPQGQARRQGRLGLPRARCRARGLRRACWPSCARRATRGRRPWRSSSTATVARPRGDRRRDRARAAST